MAVKDLVEHFDSHPITTISADDSAISNSWTMDVAASSTRPISSPARFLDTPGRVNHDLRPTNSDPLLLTEAPSHSVHEGPTLDIADSLQPPRQLPKSGLPIQSKLFGVSPTRYLLDDDDEHPLLTRGAHEYIYESDTPSGAAQSAFLPFQSHHQRKHYPIPSTLVFSRDAPPLHLPKLDKHLSSLPLPDFTSDRSGAMFSPMDKLAESGKSLDDLESNSSVAPAWRNRKTLLGSTVNAVLGFTGSSALASFYSLQGLFNTVQIFALILSTIVGGQDLEDKWRKLFLGTIPNVLALNFASTLVQSLLFLMIFMAIAAGLLYYFYRSSFHCDRYGVVEGLQQTVHVLVWSQDLWVVPNPYTNATIYPPAVPPLGPANEYRDALDFCWTTTMKRNQVNYAPVVIILAAIVFIFLTIWFPIALRRVIKVSVPKVDKFTELGRPRNNIAMDGEYHRLLSRDRNAFAFLYSGFRRGWGTYESTYLGAKLSTLFIIAVIDPDNCLFRSLSRSHLPIVRQVLLLVCTIGFFVAQCIFAPFLDPVNNASEWTSRLNYLSTSTVALIVVFDIPAENIFNTYILYTLVKLHNLQLNLRRWLMTTSSIYIITYGLSFYFTIINLGPTQRILKRFTRRIDFSIDIFSPRLDVSPSSPHTKRRIWQESITALFLTSPECAIPKEQTMTFAQARDSEYPPYLLDFCGTPGERHVENLKILREVGTLTYNKAVALVSGPDHAWYRRLEGEIQNNFIGPDCYWRNPSGPSIPGCTKYFGNAWWIPFPPTLVIRYDDGPLAVLTEASELEAYISQNSSPDIRRKRLVRLSLRALEGQAVVWPYEHISVFLRPRKPIGAYSGWFGKSRYKARKSTHYQSCLLRIKRRGHLVWNGLQMGSGFDLELRYSKKILVAGDAVGLNDDYDLTAPLARFLELNQALIAERLPYIEGAMENYRHQHRKVGRWKNRVLTYKFLSHVYNHPRDPATLAASSLEVERDTRVRHLLATCETVLQLAHHRWAFVSRSEARTWWYLFWDDLWRRNHDTTPGLKRHATDFNPHYPTSIAYTPLPRAALESFLAQRGLFSKTGAWSTFFTPGFLNKLYLRLNDTVFRSSSRAILFHIGNGSTERDMMEVDLETRIGQVSTIGTGAGTDHDDSWIRTRPNYRWEGILSDPPTAGKWRRRWFSKMGAWLGLTPLWRSGTPSDGVSLDVRLEHGRFVLIDSDDDRTLTVEGSSRWDSVTTPS
ncbi:hypothetical protein D9615_001490 [Tricholomella constricta]|uniref:Uncharacterized protein n=1 Tax=Tricholomella constricta TaxID=117010 RepID=A0A8H5M928_9AGAR|nr:hypothetical protein D9615_001490 [Tricholomella constricta]